jgi:hypothetical protein
MVQRPNIEYTRFITSMGRYRCLIIISPEVYHPPSSQRFIAPCGFWVGRLSGTFGRARLVVLIPQSMHKLSI